MKKKEHHGAKIEVTKDGPYLVSGGVPFGEQWARSKDGGWVYNARQPGSKMEIQFKGA